MQFWNFIGMLAALCSAISLVPEVVKGYKSHHLQDVSWGMLFLLVSSSALWGIYGIYLINLPLMASSGLNLAMELCLILMKVHYEITRTPLRDFFKKRKTQKQNSPAFETQTTEGEDPSLGHIE